MNYGFLYCFSNESMPGIYKIGMTERTPKLRLKEANRSDTFKPPTPYKNEIAKKVSNPKQKEQTIHSVLSQYTERINPKREFFRVSLEEVKKLFDLMDGELWVENNIEDNDEEDNDEEDDDEEDESTQVIKQTKVKGCRDMSVCFTHGQRIRHTIGINKTWEGIYEEGKGIVYNGITYKSLSKFASTHYSIVNISDNKKSANGWLVCECEVDGKWISTFNL